VAEPLDFLQELLDDSNVHRGYSAIATARSALSSILVMPNNIKFGEIDEVKQFMKAVYNLRPPIPRYQETWDADIVLQFLKNWFPANRLSMLKLSMKLSVLILLVTGRRGQILPSLNINQMSKSSTKFVFSISPNQAKEGRQGYQVKPVVLKKFPDKRICVYHYMQIYLERTKRLRGDISQIFITTKKPYKAVARDTFSRWVKTVLQSAGIDISTFKPGSTRSAATSKAFYNGATLDKVLAGGGWSRPSTFSKWYKRPIQDKKTFDDYILKSH
jgi:hypothetical protein